MKISATQVFPLVLIVIDVSASVVYLFHLDYRKAVYWAAAAILSATVTF